MPLTVCKTLEEFVAAVAAEIQRLDAEEIGSISTQAAVRLVTEAVAAEREACARLAESMDDGYYDYPPPKDVAAAIRARGES
jgi:hypothetical protein